MKKDKNLLDLPVLIYDRDMATASSKIDEAYQGELEAISSPEELCSFTERWKNLHLLKFPDSYKLYQDLNQEEEAIINGSYDAEKVFYYLQNKHSDEVAKKVLLSLPEEEQDINFHIMSTIVIPLASLESFMIARHYGVDTDLAMVRLFLDPYPELIDACRYGSGDTRKK